jgi:CheY-like chemotaxis protein
MLAPRAAEVLVVDDDAAIRNAVVGALELEGYTARAAANGAEALTLLVDEPPALIVLDLMMPVMNGWQFLEHCRQGPCQGVPVLVMSAYRQLSAEAAELGVSACIAKPFDLDVLLGAVDRLVRRRG